MKPTRKLTALLAVATLLCALILPVEVAANTAATPATQAEAVRETENPLYAAGELLETLENGEALRYFFDRIIDGLIDGQQDISVPYNGYTLDGADISIIESAVNATLPEGFGRGIGHSYGSIYTTGTGITFYSYFHSWGLTQAMEDTVNACIEELTADLTDKSDFDKCRILYDRLIHLNTYNAGVYHQTAYGALVEGMSVCAGYGRTYQLMLQKLGIPCLYVHGEANNGYQIGGHAWNIVQIDGEWYYSDPTWDDFDWEDYPITYEHFNITYDEISTDHYLDYVFEDWVPKESVLDANFYYHEGTVCDTLTVRQLAELLKKQNPLYLYVTGDRDAVISLYFDNLYQIIYLMGISGFQSASYMPAGNHGLVLYLTLDHDHDYVADATPPTCQEDGCTTYTCTICGVSYSEVIPATGEHVYDDDADADCNLCGHQRVVAIPGDADGNGKVNNRDLGLLQQRINGWEVSIDEDACDVDGNGKLNNRDLGLLQQYVNGWDVELG